MSSSAQDIKQMAHQLIDQLPEEASWDDVMCQIYERQVIEAGLADSQAGRVTEVGEVRKKYGLPE
ncbi:MAG: hypothetical protein DHS20C09_04930 [marine bacterium B5-7]|nr:MAG: hypothetical protein DHS20C09_04930 [marine bacterium B5-7]